jgi:hypothetical protein
MERTLRKFISHEEMRAETSPSTNNKLSILPPSQVDVIFAVSAVSFEEAWRDSVPGQTGDGIPVRYISLEHLIRNRTAAGRLQDLADAAALENSRAANAMSDKS